MNVKALAAIVGTLSLGALATGCASNKASEGAATTEAKGTDSNCSQKAADGASGDTNATSTPEKGSEGKCGANGCKGTK
ncbi:hypothetical protein [Hyalangium versicolor]|uniref:hypothetical protein n=1 Tax=Hyalangium versicolor TaxID=2861190 RepID=UPI001CCF79F4|nr:hypothetical protein [Hyalangium versicolor]